MCSYRGVLNEGCIVFMIDERVSQIIYGNPHSLISYNSRCSSIAMTVLNAYEKTDVPPGVSQTINTMFHSNGLV